MRIYIDGDATPRGVKDLLFRAADRVQVELVLVANQTLRHPPSRFIRQVVVGKGFDVADEYIVDQVEEGDLVITADVPLAAAAVDKGAVCIDPRGDVIDASNAQARLTMRNFMEQQRESGTLMGGPSAYSERDKRKFAGALDRILTKYRTQRDRQASE
ncbi:MAG: YaiI/YqxD family protein [Myxococcales bacterium]|nr:YaiI/YqxD family protein [Myxococcales bacterium]